MNHRTFTMFKHPLIRSILPVACFGLAMIGSSPVANAATLQTYFNFTSYGSVSGGNNITSSSIGFSSTTATVKSSATSLTGSGLAITAGTNAGSTGVSMAGSALSSFTGDFTLQIWVHLPGYHRGQYPVVWRHDHGLSGWHYGGRSSAFHRLHN